MIYTVTLNPSIDYIVRLDKLTIGITNRTTSEEYYYGGKGINVSMVLAELGIDSTAYGFVAGFTGKAIENGIRNDHIITDFIKLDHGISRINIKIKAGEETEINGQGPHIGDAELERLLQKIDRIGEGDTLVLAGSIPNTMPDDVYERMMERISRKNAGGLLACLPAGGGCCQSPPAARGVYPAFSTRACPWGPVIQSSRARVFSSASALVPA